MNTLKLLAFLSISPISLAASSHQSFSFSFDLTLADAAAPVPPQTSLAAMKRMVTEVIAPDSDTGVGGLYLSSITPVTSRKDILRSLEILHTVNLTKRTYQIAGITTTNVPIMDSFGAADILGPLLDKLGTEITTQRDQGHNVLVHCEMGISRSTTLICDYLVHHYSWDFANAFDYLRAIHPKTEPNGSFYLLLTKRSQALRAQRFAAAEPKDGVPTRSNALSDNSFTGIR